MFPQRSYVTRKGQVTIPHELRERFGLHEGDRVEWTQSGDAIILRPAESVIDRISGIFANQVPVADISDLDQILDDENRAVERAIAEDWTKSETSE